jgi:hypothetical protein
MMWTLKAQGGTPRGVDAAEVYRALALLADPDHGVELRGLPSGRSRVMPADDLDGLAAAAEELGDDRGVYYCLNPVPAGLGHAARVGDVIRRRWLLVDVDPVKAAKDVSATDAEHLAAFALANRVAAFLCDRGWPSPVVVDSGNGTHLLYRVDLPNTADARVLLRGVLHALAGRFDAPEATIDRAVHNASRVAKLPGTWARKGPDTEDRPHRLCRLLAVPEPVAVVPEALLRDLAEPAPAPPVAAPAEPGPSNGAADSPFVLTAGEPPGAAYARAALEAEVARVLTARPGDQGGGGRNNALNRAAFSLGQLVGGGVLVRADVEDALLHAAALVGILGSERHKTEETLKRALEDGVAQPRTTPEPAAPAPPRRRAATWDPDVPAPDLSLEDVATIHDLVAAGAQVQWLWPDWIQNGVLTAIAAPGGTGKTRFCADLLRRVRHGLAWPDAQAVDVPADALALWVVADNHHDELVTLARDFDVVDSIRINASRAEPYGGVSLETADDYNALEARVKAVRPAFVVVDTVGNATDKKLSVQEDAKAFYWPLQVIARRHRTAILCLTHLNATGQFLGRRILEKVRVAIKIEQPDADNPKRRLEVKKSNSKVPAVLGMTMHDNGNEYDNDPPRTADQEAKPGPPPAKVKEAADWLKDWLLGGAKRVGNTISAAEDKGIKTQTLYRAKGLLGLYEFQAEGGKWWRLPSEDDPFNA